MPEFLSQDTSDVDVGLRRERQGDEDIATPLTDGEATSPSPSSKALP
jgi:hypothetical protein